MHSVIPRYLIGTQAFLSYCTDQHGQLAQWIDRATGPSIGDRGIVVSLASLLQIRDTLHVSDSMPGEMIGEGPWLCSAKMLKHDRPA